MSDTAPGVTCTPSVLDISPKFSKSLLAQAKHSLCLPYMSFRILLKIKFHSRYIVLQWLAWSAGRGFRSKSSFFLWSVSKILVNTKILGTLRGGFGKKYLLNTLWTSLMLFDCSYPTLTNDACCQWKGDFSWSGDWGCVFDSFFKSNLQNDTMINIKKCAFLYKCRNIVVVYIRLLS